MYLAHMFNTLQRLEDETSEQEDQLPRLSVDIREKQYGYVERMPPFVYRHRGLVHYRPADALTILGMLAYIGHNKAVADLTLGFGWGDVVAGGRFTYYLWRSAHFSILFSPRNRILGERQLTLMLIDSSSGLDEIQDFRKRYFSSVDISTG